MKTANKILAAFAGLALAGCASAPQPNQPTAKELGAQQWNATRASVLLTLAKDQYNHGNFDKCKQTIDQAERLDPKSDAISVLSAQLAIEQGDMDIAEHELEQARTNNPKNAQAFYLTGVVFQRWDQPQRAYEMYTQAATLDSTQLAYVMARAEMLVSMDRASEALALLQDKVSQFENSAVLCDAVGMLLAQQHRDAEALDMLQRATILAPEDKGIREHYSLELMRVHSYPEAADQLHRLLAPPAPDPYNLPDPTEIAKADDFANRSDLWMALGECQMQTRDVTGAKSSFETAVSLDATNIDALLSLGKASMAAGDVTGAQQCVDKAMALDDHNAQTLLLGGYVDLKRGQARQAFDCFEAASRLSPLDGTNFCMMGYALQKMDQRAKALECYARALELSPNDDLAKSLMDDAKRGM